MTDRTITVTASGRVTDRAETVRVKIEATGRGQSQTAARRGAEDRVASVREAIQSLDLPSNLERREATVKHKSSLFDADEDDPAYRATVRCTLACRPAQTEDVFLAVGDAGGDVLSMDRVLAPERRDKLHHRALTAATERARQRAEAIAQGEDLSLGPVQSVEHVDTDGMGSIVDEALVDLPVETVDLDGVEVTESVEAVFAVEE